jgi:prepilin-type N-terminal cleavage/methylation domain-containing protein
MNFSLNRTLKKTKLKAFTLIELLISMSIIALMATISISSYPKFSEQVSLSSEVYRMLAHFKEAQVFGTAAYVNPGTKVVYGFLVDKQAGTVVNYQLENPTSFLNQDYQTRSSIDSSAKTIILKTKFEIESIEGIFRNSTTTLEKIYVFYKRPNPEARLTGLIGTNISPDPNLSSFSKVTITLRSKQNQQFKKKVVILQTGQMYVDSW